jgi:hypothetical protein
MIETREVDQFDLGAGVSFGNQVGDKALAGEQEKLRRADQYVSPQTRLEAWSGSFCCWT